jgi:flagellin-specific chaperone FliS
MLINISFDNMICLKMNLIYDLEKGRDLKKNLKVIYFYLLK